MRSRILKSHLLTQTKSDRKSPTCVTRLAAEMQWLNIDLGGCTWPAPALRETTRKLQSTCMRPLSKVCRKLKRLRVISTKTAKVCRVTIERLLIITLQRRRKGTSRQRTISLSCTDTVTGCGGMFDKPWIGIGALPKAEMLSRNATWAYCISAEKASHKAMRWRPNGFGRRQRMAMYPGNRSLPGCTSWGRVSFRTTQWQHTGCNWPRRLENHVHKEIWDISTSKERACRLTMSRLTCGTKRQSLGAT